MNSINSTGLLFPILYILYGALLVPGSAFSLSQFGLGRGGLFNTLTTPSTMSLG